MGRDTKEQHFVPRMYLKHFTYDGKNCFTKNKNGIINSQDIRKICKRKNLYEFKNINGDILYKNLVEKALAKTEEYYNELLLDMFSYFETLNDGDIIIYSENIERTGIFTFLTSMILRNPIIMDETKQILKIFGKDANDLQVKNAGIKNNFELLESTSLYMEEKFNIIIHKNITKTPFITCDVPFASIKLNTEHQMMYMPLSPKYFLILTPRKLVGKCADIFVENKNLDVEFFNQFFSFEQCEKISISNKKIAL